MTELPTEWARAVRLAKAALEAGNDAFEHTIGTVVFTHSAGAVRYQLAGQRAETLTKKPESVEFEVRKLITTGVFATANTADGQCARRAAMSPAIPAAPPAAAAAAAAAAAVVVLHAKSVECPSDEQIKEAVTTIKDRLAKEKRGSVRSEHVVVGAHTLTLRDSGSRWSLRTSDGNEIASSFAGLESALRTLGEENVHAPANAHARRTVWTLRDACEHGCLESVQDMARNGADIHNDIEGVGQRPINIACRNGNLLIVKWLHLHEGVSLDARDGEGGGSAMHAACQGGHKIVAEWLGCAKTSFDIVDSKGMQPLHHACEHAYLPIVEWLCDLGASLNVVDDDQLTPIARAHYFARQNPSASEYHHLLDYLANVMICRTMLAHTTLAACAAPPPRLLGQCVKIHGLSSWPTTVDGELGVAQSFNGADGRYGVLLLGMQYDEGLADGRRTMGQWVHVKPENLERLMESEHGSSASCSRHAHATHRCRLSSSRRLTAKRVRSSFRCRARRSCLRSMSASTSRAIDQGFLCQRRWWGPWQE